MKQLFIIPGANARISDSDLRAGVKGLATLLSGDFRVHCVGRGQERVQPRENLWIVYLVAATESGTTVDTVWPYYAKQPHFKVQTVVGVNWLVPLVEAIRAAKQLAPPDAAPELGAPAERSGIGGSITLIPLPEPPAGSPVVAGTGMHELQSPPGQAPQEPADEPVGDIPADVGVR